MSQPIILSGQGIVEITADELQENNMFNLVDIWTEDFTKNYYDQLQTDIQTSGERENKHYDLCR